MDSSETCPIGGGVEFPTPNPFFTEGYVSYKRMKMQFLKKAVNDLRATLFRVAIHFHDSEIEILAQL